MPLPLLCLGDGHAIECIEFICDCIDMEPILGDAIELKLGETFGLGLNDAEREGDLRGGGGGIEGADDLECALE